MGVFYSLFTAPAKGQIEERVMDPNFIRFAKKEVQELFEHILDLAEVAIGHTDQYKVFRGRVLRYGNNCLRNLDTYAGQYEQELNVALKLLETDIEDGKTKKCDRCGPDSELQTTGETGTTT